MLLAYSCLFVAIMLEVIACLAEFLAAGSDYCAGAVLCRCLLSAYFCYPVNSTGNCLCHMVRARRVYHRSSWLLSV